jgi:serine/threonine protein kinase/Flp pilus assembly protein TadD
MTTWNPQANELFLQARELPSPAVRREYLDRVCADDMALRAEVEGLLEASDRAGSFLASPLPAAQLFGIVADRPGTVIGPYKLLEQIGEGGFGVVFFAEQQQPVRRKVALKVLKPGMDTRQVVARFEAERQALALMDHPNIAKVFDGGATPSGRPYFVMELVKGAPLTAFCDYNHLTPRERLELFVAVCQAVQHAHQKGIIHRDLKPSNVLVTMHDTMPVVKVIDFGVAKALGQELTDKTLFTGFTQLIGTPLYMSPEQAGQSGLDVDTRSDIYALGVLLYELLTGTTPFDEERLRTASYDELRRIICEEEPHKPSTRISTLGQAAAATVSANRRSDPHKLGRLFRGELDWIVMKALEKDRNRRYASASAFAADVQRYLHDEPVEACPPSRWYQLRKLAQRNKGTFVTASALALAALLVVIDLATSNVRIRQEQERAMQEKERAEKAQALAEQRAEQIRDGLERLKSAHALLDRSRAFTVDMRWYDAHAALTKAVQLRPDLVSGWAELADLHTRLGLWELAAAEFERELELRQPDAPYRWYFHALLRLYLGDKESYRRIAGRMREHFRGTPNANFLIELVRAGVLKPDADADFDEWAEMAQHARACRVAGDWFSRYVLGLTHYRAGHHAEAVRWLRESLEADRLEWSVRALNYPVLAMAHHRLGQQAEARVALQAAARVFDHWTEGRFKGQADKHWVHHRGATASWPVPWWDWLEGRLYYREAKLLIDGSPPPDDPRVHVLRGRALAALRRHAQADTEYTLALQQLPQDPQIRLEAHRNRGYGCIQRDQWKQAAAELDQASILEPQEMHLRHFRTLAHLIAGEEDAYRQNCAALVQQFEKTSDPEVAWPVLQACVLRPDALPDMARLLPLARVASLPHDCPPTEAGAALFRTGQYAEAVHSLERTAKVYRLRAGDWCFLAMAHHRLGHAAQARHALSEAVRWTDEANHRELDDLTDTRPNWGAWHEKPVCELLLDEATRLLAHDSPHGP